MKNINLKRLLPAALLFMGSLQAIGQTAGQQADSGFYSDFFTTVLVVAAAIIVVAALFAMYRLLDQSVKMQQMKIYEENGLTEYLDKMKKDEKKGWWGKFMQDMEGSVDLDKESDILFDHEFDGIQELDNKLPPWWLGLFYATIVFGVVYIGYYHFGSGPSQAEEYTMEMEEAEARVAAYIESQGGAINENNVELLTDEAGIAAGKEIYLASCAACHLADGGGQVGPNFTDDNWIHGCDIKDVYKTIRYGIPEKGMISWESQLSPTKMQQVGSYILTLRGTTPAVAKEAQGEICIPDAAPTDGATEEGTTEEAAEEAVEEVMN